MTGTETQVRKPQIGDTRSGEFTRASDKDIKKMIRKMTSHKPGSGLVIRHARQV